MGKKLNYAFKSYVLNEHKDLLIKQRQMSKREHAEVQLFYDGIVDKKALTEYPTRLELVDECLQKGLMWELEEATRINVARYKRVGRLKERIKNMLLKGTCLFVTMTFSNEILETTTPEQRRNLVTRYLKKHNCSYVANIDFGGKRGREHYHAIAQTECLNLNEWFYNYGIINVETIKPKNLDTDTTKLSKYVSKLTNHAIKETTKRGSMIYSR